MVTIKSEREIELMREAGKILAKVHEELGKVVRPGISTKEIDRICEEMIRSYGCIPSFLGYEGYPASVCISINDEVVHGIPNKHRYLNEGDIVSLDTGVIWKGYQSDAARTHMIGEVTPQARKLVEVTQQSFFEGIKFAKAGNHLNDISAAIQKYAESFGFGVVRDLVGHGIGSHLHEDPEIPNFARKRKGINKKINSLKERMKGKKRIIVTLLFFINIIMLTAAVIPHHHHPNGAICMKQDLPVEQQCPKHHHHPASDSCCSSECMTRFHSPIPSFHTDSGPDYVFIATLFTDGIIEHLLKPQERRVKNYYVYRDSLHGTNIPRTTSLRAPPYSVFA